MTVGIRLVALVCALLSPCIVTAQVPVSLRTSDPRFAPRWANVPAPTTALQLERHGAAYADSRRPAGTYEIAYALVDEAWAISPVSPAVTVTATASDWDCIGTTPNVPLWTRATGILWVYRQQGQAAWKPLAVDENRPHSWLAMKPFKAITGWHHDFGGHKLYQAGIGFPDLSDATFYPPSSVLAAAPPAPVVRLLECRNQDYEVAYSWACNDGETALSPVLSVPKLNVNPDRHKTLRLLRSSPAGRQQPPQGALGMYLYMRTPGGNWHRQPAPDGTGNLWQLDYVSLPVSQYVESGIEYQGGAGRSYLSSLHLALMHWNRDVIIDTDMTICCPLISEYNGMTWDYMPRNHWVAILQPFGGDWVFTIDGVSTPAMPRVTGSNNGTEWPSYQQVIDATFGAGNIKVSFYWHNYAPKLEFIGKYAATDMTGRYSVGVEPVVATQAGQGWVLVDAGYLKFKRKIATGNAGNWRVEDAAATPDGVTGYPMGWMHWLECSQMTKLVGCSFIMKQARIGIATSDACGGGCFHFNPVECNVHLWPTNPHAVTYGLRCLESSGWGWNGHLCSEMIAEKCHLQAKFPIVMEGVQAANWQIRDATCNSNGTFDSAIITAANGGTLYLGGRFTCDGARTLIAANFCKKVTVENLWIDGGMPALLTCNANSFTTLILNGGKINQWENWLHAIEAPAGSSEAYTMVLKTDNLDSQTNGPVQAKLCNPKPGQALYQPRIPAEVPFLLQSLLP